MQPISAGAAPPALIQPLHRKTGYIHAVLRHSAMLSAGRANTHKTMISEGGPPACGGPRRHAVDHEPECRQARKTGTAMDAVPGRVRPVGAVVGRSRADGATRKPLRGT